jgi:hypothetical protein
LRGTHTPLPGVLVLFTRAENPERFGKVVSYGRSMSGAPARRLALKVSVNFTLGVLVRVQPARVGPVTGTGQP